MYQTIAQESMNSILIFRDRLRSSCCSRMLLLVPEVVTPANHIFYVVPQAWIMLMVSCPIGAIAVVYIDFSSMSAYRRLDSSNNGSNGTKNIECNVESDSNHRVTSFY